MKYWTKMFLCAILYKIVPAKETKIQFMKGVYELE